MSLLSTFIKQKSYFLKKNSIYIISVDFYASFFATRIRIHVFWSGSGSGQMIRIRNTGRKIRIPNNFKTFSEAFQDKKKEEKRR